MNLIFKKLFDGAILSESIEVNNQHHSFNQLNFKLKKWNGLSFIDINLCFQLYP